MTKFKIILIITVLAVICAGIFFWVQSVKPPEEVKIHGNPFINKIEKEITELKARPDNQFCYEFYDQISSNINDFYTQNRFDSNSSQNTEWKEILVKKLYAAYTEKFIKQANIVFSGAEWNENKIRFIQSEKNKLKRSSLLSGGSPVDNELSSIQKVLDQYNQVVSFISACKSFNYSNTELAARFPIAEVQSKISRANSLRQNQLENRFVNNCTRLHDDLKEIPQLIFKAHIAYLDNKINYWSGMYTNYNSQSDYSNNLYKPLKAEIELLDNSIYNLSNFNFEYNKLVQKWKDDNIKAYNHKY